MDQDCQGYRQGGVWQVQQAIQGPPPLSVCVSCHASIEVTNSRYQAKKDPEFKDFRDISMDGIEEVNKLDKYLSLPIEKVSNLIVWQWEHRHTYPHLSAMAFDFLSTPNMLVISLDILLWLTL
jgi:hypothetical protein